MASYNAYLSYKRDTKQLLYWIIRASNAVIKAFPDDNVDACLNTTGQTTVAELVVMSKRIAKHIKPIPPAIYSLFQSVIDARKSTWSVFQRITANTKDREIEKSNATHKFFIDALTEAFVALGGTEWASKQDSTADASLDEDDINTVIFSNKFGALTIRGSQKSDEENEGSSGEESDHEAKPVTAPRRRVQKKGSSKSKKGKHKKKPKGKRMVAPTKEANLDDVPLESFRIIQDEEGIMTDYLAAVYDLILECSHLRSSVQDLWHEAAYCDLNTAIAAAVSNVAISMVTRMELSIFVDFPGHDSYETVMNTITRGCPEKAQGMFSATLVKVDPEGGVGQPVYNTDIDVKEQFMINTYRDLLDFVTDFQQTRSGKPTKRMLTEIRNWDPHFDVKRATKEQRLKWRRSYTINWLYDLVNVFSAIVVQRNTIKGEKHAYEKIDWSPSGPWHMHRRLFGLNEFAGVITSLAMQKPGTDVRKKILPHHVFQLQCIVDSLMVSRGWVQDPLRGQVLDHPAEYFRPRRDVDLFLDRNNKRIGHGYLAAVEMLRQLLDRDAARRRDPRHHKEFSAILDGAMEDFRDWLGETKYMYGLINIPPSRFSNTNSNGLWEYSPFLCGAGLVESLQLSHPLGMALWDRIPEPTLLVHLHNMLVKRGYIKEPVGLFSSLEQLFQSDIFNDGQVPTAHFTEALAAHVHEANTRRSVFQHRASTRLAARTAVDMHGLLDPKLNRFFKTKSQLVLYGQANWDPDRIPFEDLPLSSVLSYLRIVQAKKTVDPTTGRIQFEDNDFIRRAKSKGMDDNALLSISSSFDHFFAGNDEAELTRTHLDAVQNAVPPGYKASVGFSNSLKAKKQGHLTGTDLLGLVKVDISNDVCGVYPLSAANYISMTSLFFMLFEKIEDELSRRKNRLYMRAFETDPELGPEKRINLALLALAEEDDECLSVMAQEFQNPRYGLMACIYWDDLSGAPSDDVGPVRVSF